MGMTPEQEYIARHGPPLATKDIQPYTAFFVDQDWLLTTSIYNSASNLNVCMTARMLLPNGEAVTLTNSKTVASDQSQDHVAFRLPRGFLLSVIVFVNSGNAKRGQCHVEIQIDSSADAGILIGELAAGYISDNASLVWPGGVHESGFSGRGHIKVVTGTDPAVNTEISETVPTNVIWRLISFHARLVADANAANRNPELEITDGTNEYYRVGNAASVVANGNVTFSWGPVGVHVSATSLSQTLPLPHDLFLKAGHVIQTETANLQVGDNWNAVFYLVEEWIDR